MVSNNNETMGTNFTVSIEASVGVTTGISAADRARTIKTAIDPESTFHDIRSPGHVFPLSARQGGVLRRAGHTEAAVDLAQMAKMLPGGVICEITLPSGLHDIVNTILDWAEKNGSHEIVILDGVASTSHDDKAFCAAEEDLCRVMEDSDIKMIPQGFITGVAGGLLNECLVRKIQGVTLLVKANDKGPDPLASATLVEAVNRAYDMNIDTTELRKEKKRIDADFRELSDKYTEHRKIDSNMYM